MPFVLCNADPSEGWKPVEQVDLAGERGPLAAFVLGRAPASAAGFGWRLSSDEILRALGIPDTQSWALGFRSRLSKAVPNRVTEIQGYSSGQRTSIFVRLEDSYLLLHLSGGTVERNWTWISDIDVPGPMVPSDAMEFFARAAFGGQPSRNGNGKPSKEGVVAQMCDQLETRFSRRDDVAASTEPQAENEYIQMRHGLETRFGQKSNGMAPPSNGNGASSGPTPVQPKADQEKNAAGSKNRKADVGQGVLPLLSRKHS
jgi:hypothetical protein